MIKLIVFDLDGVLVDAKKIHFDSLNKAIYDVTSDNKYVITNNEHLTTYDGLKTNVKLDLLEKNKGLDKKYFNDIFTLKQKYTIEMLDTLEFNNDLYLLFEKIKADGLNIAVSSNSILNTITKCLDKLGVSKFVDNVYSNEDVLHCKPHPEIYWKTMSKFGVFPYETLIVEDSPVGLKAASESKAFVCRVKDTKDTNINTIYDSINKCNGIISNNKWSNKNMNIVIPMAGLGSRFSAVGYTYPKPLIEVRKKPMIQVVVDNLNTDANYIFIVRSEHMDKYNLKSLLELISPNCKIILTDKVTKGAACTALLAKDLINNDNPLFFANSDQFVEWNSSEFFYKMQETNVDGGIVTFKSTHPKWSFAKLDSNGYVEKVEEKNPISDIATVGFYYWKHGSDFVKYAEQMIDKNILVNNEFYVCPVYNEAIADNKKITVYNCDGMWGIGTPEDLDYFLLNYKNEI